MASMTSSTSSTSASARKPTWPRLTPSTGRPAPPRHLGGAQDRPVAADDHRELAVDRQVGVAVDDLDRRVVRRRLDPEVRGLLGQQPDHDVVLGQRLAEAERDVAGRVAARVREQQDAPGRAGRRPVGLLGHGLKPLRPHPRRRSAPHGVVDVVLGDLRRAPPQPQEELHVARRPRQRARRHRPGAPAQARRPARRPPPPPRPGAPGRGPRRPCRPGPCRPRTAA